LDSKVIKLVFFDNDIGTKQVIVLVTIMPLQSSLIFASKAQACQNRLFHQDFAGESVTKKKEFFLKRRHLDVDFGDISKSESDL
jgi:hypothetical protein